jgi:transcriptional regulator with XRE-family HTH domain
MARPSKSTPEEYTAHERAVAKAVGVRIRERRKFLGFTQEHLRIKLELESIVITKGQFSRIENGESLLNIAQIIAIVSVLGVSYRWLLEGKEPVEAGENR